MGTSYGIVRDSTSGALYISDHTYNRIVLYPSTTHNSTLVFGDAGIGTNNTQLYNPIGLIHDSFSNSLVIANFGAHNIVRYVSGATHWTLVVGNMNGMVGANSTSFNCPVDMMYDPMGNLYVVDTGNNRIQFFPDGEIVGTTIAGITSVAGGNATTLSSPWAVRLDSQLNMYVADTNNHRIQKFFRY